MIKKETLNFFKELEKNNNKPWFETNKPRYLASQEYYLNFIEELLPEVRKIEHIHEKELKKYVNRIYRDNRFSKEKIPYNTYIRTSIDRDADDKKCPFYLHVESNNTFVAGGIWQPTPGLLKKVRQEIDFNGSELNKIISKKSFSKMFGTMYGESLAKAPTGYLPENPNIELIKLKQFIVKKKFDDALVCSKDFIQEILLSYKEILPFLNFFDALKGE